MSPTPPTCWLPIAALLAASAFARAEEPAAATVGMTGKVDQVVLPGSELEAKPADPVGRLLVRVVGAYPHGSAFRYDLAFTASEAGTYDLRDYLRRKDGSSTDGLPAIPVRIAAVLPPGAIRLHGIRPPASPWLGGYRLAMTAVAATWAAGLAYLILRGRRGVRESDGEAAPPIGVADRLRPLVREALDGTLDPSRRAELERLLIGLHLDRLGLQDARPLDAMTALRADPEAGPLLRLLEDWLHRPNEGDEGPPAALAAALRPYLDVPAEPGLAERGATT